MQGSSMVMSEVIASLHEYTRPSGWLACDLSQEDPSSSALISASALIKYSRFH